MTDVNVSFFGEKNLRLFTCKNYSSAEPQTGKTAAIRRAAVREERALGIRGDQLRDSLGPSQHYRIKGAYNLFPIMPRHASLSDGECKFFSSIVDWA